MDDWALNCRKLVFQKCYHFVLGVCWYFSFLSVWRLSWSPIMHIRLGFGCLAIHPSTLMCDWKSHLSSHTDWFSACVLGRPSDIQMVPGGSCDDITGTPMSLTCVLCCDFALSTTPFKLAWVNVRLPFSPCVHSAEFRGVRGHTPRHISTQVWPRPSLHQWPALCQ